MKPLLSTLLLFIFFIPISCKQNTKQQHTKPEKEVFEIPKIKLTDTTKKEEANKIVKAIKTKQPLDTITGISTNGKPLKILIYKYLYPNNTKYIRDFDIVNSNDSIILSAMQKEYHWRGDVSADDIGEINIVPSYYLKNDSILDIALGFYIKPYDIAEDLDRYDIGSVREYLSYTIEEYQFEDSVMTLMNMTFTNTKINTLNFLVKVNNEEVISNDSIFNILENNKEKTSWGITAIINGSLKNIINDSMKHEQFKQIELLHEYPLINSDLSIAQYIIQSIVYHRNQQDYVTIYND